MVHLETSSQVHLLRLWLFQIALCEFPGRGSDASGGSTTGHNV